MLKNRCLLLIIFLLSQIDLGYPWPTLDGPSVAMASKVLAVNDQTMLVGLYQGGFWKTDDGGGTWQPLNHRITSRGALAVANLQLADESGDTILARLVVPGIVTRYYLSCDQGDSWSPIVGNFAESGYDQCTVDRWDPATYYYLGRRYFARTFDAGQSWEYWLADSTLNQKQGIFQDRWRPERLYYTGYYFSIDGNEYGGLVASEDRGITWNHRQPLVHFEEELGLNEFFIHAFLQMSNGQFILSQDVYPRTSYRFIICDSTGAVSDTTGHELPFWSSIKQIVEDTEQPGRLYAITTTNGFVYCSNDYGISWQVMIGEGLPDGVSGIQNLYQRPATGALYLATTDNGILESENHGQSWSPAMWPPAYGVGQANICGDRLFMLTHGGAGWWSCSLNENEWDRLVVPTLSDTLVLPRLVYWSNGDTLLANIHVTPTHPEDGSYPYLARVVRSTDNGQTWDMGPIDERISGYLQPYSRQDGTIRVAGMTNDGLIYSLDLGESWIPLNGPGLTQSADLEYLQTDSSCFYVRNNALYEVIIRENEWRDLGFPGTLTAQGQSLALFEGQVVVCTNDGTVWWYDGHGWAQGEPLGGYVDLMACGSRLAALDGNTLYSTTGPDVQWSMQELDYPYSDQSFRSSFVANDTLRRQCWIATGVGMLKLDYNDVTTVDPVIHCIPTTPDLLTSYPNPFNQQTIVHFDLPRSEHVSLKLYSLLGREVATLVEDVLPAGLHQRSLMASGLASGTYILRLHHGGMTTSRRITLLK